MTRYSWADDIHDKVSPANPQRENGGASSGTGSAAPNQQVVEPFRSLLNALFPSGGLGINVFAVGRDSATQEIAQHIGSLAEELEAKLFADLTDAAEERGEE